MPSLDSNNPTLGASGVNGSGHVPVQVRPDDPAADAIRAALAEGHYWLGVNAPRALSGDPEGVHYLRTTTRRVRTALELFRDLTDREWSDRLAEEFKWLGGLLGEVRDLDVTAGRYRAAADAAGDGAVEAIGPLFEETCARHGAASQSLRESLRGERFERLAGSLAEAVVSIPFNSSAQVPCREALPPLVKAAWKDLKRDGRALEDDSPDDNFHEVRKRAKRTRYATEAVRSALDPDQAAAAGRFARRVRQVQDVLGAHQDAVVAADELRRSAVAHPDLGRFNFAAGRLFERESRASAACRDQFFEVWPDLDRKKVVRWLTT